MSESICNDCRHFGPDKTGRIFECKKRGYAPICTDDVRNCDGFESDEAVSRVQRTQIGGDHYSGMRTDDGAMSRVQIDIERLPDSAPTVADLIRQECNALCDMLLEKNAKYGNSALEPIRCFSRADPFEQIRVRLDDKLSRIMRGQGNEDEDVVKDLMGYLVLLRVAERMRGEA